MIAVGFDFDGTLVDSFGAISSAARRAAAEVGAELTPQAERALSALSLEDYGQVIRFEDDGQFTRFKSAFRSVFDRECYRDVFCLPGAREALADCAARVGEDAVFVLTNRRLDSVLQIMAHLDMCPPLGGVHSSASGHPVGNRKIAKLQALVERYVARDSSKVLYVGDAPADVEAALASGALPVLCVRDQHLAAAHDPKEVIIVRTLSEVAPLLSQEHLFRDETR